MAKKKAWQKLKLATVAVSGIPTAAVDIFIYQSSVASGKITGGGGGGGRDDDGTAGVVSLVVPAVAAAAETAAAVKASRCSPGASSAAA